MGRRSALAALLLLLVASTVAQRSRKRQEGCTPDSYKYYYSSSGESSSGSSWYESHWTFPPCEEPTQRPNLTTPSPVRTTRPGATITTGVTSGAITTGRTPPPTTIPPPPPPAACSLNAIAYSVHAKYFLQGARSSVEFCARPKVRAACNRVDWTVNGRSIGSSDDGCITYNTGLITTGSLEMIAVGVNNANTKGVPVSIFLPIFTMPTWFLVLFGNPGTALLGRGDNWGYRDNAEIFAPFSTVLEQHLPLIGCKFRLGMNLEALFQVQDSGSATVEGSGGIQVTIEPDGGPVAGGKVRASLGADFGVRSLGRGLYEPKLDTLSVGLNGEVTLPTPWMANYMTTIPVIGTRVGVKIFILVVVGASIRATFEFAPERRPLPLSFKSISGGLTLGLQVSGECALFASTMVNGRGTVTPMLQWSSAGFAFNGVALQAIISIQFTVFGKEITIYPVSGTWTCTRSGCSRTGKKRDDDSGDFFAVRDDAPPSEWVPISAKWNPTITAQVPFTVSSVYPSGSVVIASVNGHQMLTFLTMVGTTTQVMYSTRLSGGVWSDLATVPAASGAVDFPVLAAVPSTNSFLLVASQNDGESLTSAQLVYATYSTEVGSSWTAYAPLLPGTATANVLDLMPTTSQDGTMVAFLRIEGNAKVIMTTHRTAVAWSHPIDVTDMEASAFAFDCLPTGEALLAFSSFDTNMVTICYMAANSNAWSCAGTARTSSSKLNVLAVGINFVIVYANDTAIIADLYASSGNLITSRSIAVEQSQRLTVAQSNNGNSLAVIGWETSTATNNTFHYALFGQDGSILSSPALKIAHTAPTNAFWAPVATSLEADGDSLLYASMLRTANPDGSYDGLLTVRELAFAAEATISNVTFNPTNWLSSIVTAYATVHNNGLAPLNLNGKGAIEFSLISSDGNSTVLATAALGTVSPGGEARVVAKLTLADALPDGGILSVAYTGIDVFNAQPFFTDPCKYQLRDSRIVSTQDGAKALVTLTAPGVCATDVILSVSFRDDEGEVEEAGSSTLTVSPNYKKSLEIPITNSTLMSSTMIVSVKGLKQEMSIISVVEANSYDFGFLPRTFKVISAKPGEVVVSVAVTNAGSTSATGVPVLARLLASDGSGKEILSVPVDVVAHETGQSVTMTLDLKAEVNNVQFVINDPAAPTFPEVYTANNIFNAAVMVPGGSDKGSYVNPDNKGRKDPSSGRAGIIAVCVLFAVAVVAVVAATVVIYLKTRGSNSARVDTSAGGSYEPVNLGLRQ